ncbi:nucleoside triphosphate pyrophosphohydrolase family protein [Candidatus Saccharibacteria bacterium]|nr:nucleoside triphosphate pyrophosphohydrolase family protein [Candidatus Saccharibacteria bacterium]
MTFSEYQKQAITTALPHPDPLMYKTIMAMGVAGEAGEVLEKWKKIVAYKEGKVTKEELKELGKELADVVWYIAVLADALGIEFDDIMAENLAKLQDRKKRGVQRGSGDNR